MNHLLNDHPTVRAVHVAAMLSLICIKLGITLEMVDETIAIALKGTKDETS